MEDLIKRKDAVDAINKIAPVDTEYDCNLLDRIDVRYVLTELPSAQPTLYGYSIDHLALIADVMKKEGVSPEEAERFFNDTQRIYQMLVDEIQKQVEGMVESCVT